MSWRSAKSTMRLNSEKTKIDSEYTDLYHWHLWVSVETRHSLYHWQRWVLVETRHGLQLYMKKLESTFCFAVHSEFRSWITSGISVAIKHHSLVSTSMTKQFITSPVSTSIPEKRKYFLSRSDRKLERVDTKDRINWDGRGGIKCTATEHLIGREKKKNWQGMQTNINKQKSWCKREKLK